MIEIKLDLDDEQKGRFRISESGQETGFMDVAISGDELIVYHTETSVANKGYAKQLLDFMIAYARTNRLKVRPYCPYVYHQFKKHPDLYADISAVKLRTEEI